jgi:hypothetical protein
MSQLEVDKVIPQSGTTLTLGESGDTVSVPSGATLDASNATLTLPDDSVTTAKIDDGAVTSAKITYPLTTFSSTGIDDDGTSTAITINSDNNVALAGNIGIGGATPTTSGTGITFPATQSASTNANTLDDYEEGTWTPTYVASTTDFTSITYQAQNGTYTKIGRLVIVNIVMSTNSITAGAAAGEVYIDGLPFTPIQNGSNGTVLYGATNWAGDNPDGWTTFGNTRGYLFYRTGTTFSSINPADLGTGGSANNYIATLTYFV